MRERFRKHRWAAIIVLLAATSAFATAAAAERAFKEHCGKCHSRATSVARGLKGDTERERRETLAKFLPSHHAQDAKPRAEIIDYLIGLSAQ